MIYAIIKLIYCLKSIRDFGLTLSLFHVIMEEKRIDTSDMTVAHLRSNMVLSKTFVWDRPEGRDDYLFIIFKSPSVVEIGGKKLYAEIGDGILFAPNQPQKYYPRQGKFVHDFMHFEFENDAQEREFSSIPRSEVIHLFNPTAMSEILSMIEEEKMSPVADRFLLHSLLQSFLLMALKSTRESTLSRYSDVLSKLRMEIIRNPEKTWEISNMAKETQLSKSYLQMLFKKQFGISCVDAVISARLEMAKSLLTESQMSVSEIGELCGYNNTEHFIRQFKSRLGISPLQYRSEQN